MKCFTLAVLALVVPATVARAKPGDSWIIPISGFIGSDFITVSGAGYMGSNAYRASGMSGTRRVYWTIAGVNLPTTAELYDIEFFDPTAGAVDWQPIDSQYRGPAGELFPIDSNIPWAGVFGTNHQYVGTEGSNSGTFRRAGPGPHAPESADFNAGGNGSFMWLTAGSQVYAKWDYPWSIDHTWSHLRITQVTPEPTSLALLTLGAVAYLRRRRTA